MIGQESPFLVRDINTQGVVGDMGPRNFLTIGDVTFFAAPSPSTGTELWKTDGTLEGTVLVSDIEEGAAGSFPDFLTDVDGTLFFIASTTETGVELWATDGTDAGTRLVRDIIDGRVSSHPGSMSSAYNSRRSRSPASAKVFDQ
jgi:ELWxxDGT repeat protein